MNFLQELKSSYLAVQSEYEHLKASKKSTADVIEKYEALETIMSYVKSGKWTNRKEFAHRVIVLVTKPTPVAMEELGITDKRHIAVILNRGNRKLTELLGEDLLGKILQGKVVEAMVAFRKATATAYKDKVLPPYILEKLPEGTPTKTYALSDCVTEIKFLAMYSEMVLAKRLEAVDDDKLLSVLSLLDYYECKPNEPIGEVLRRIIRGEAKVETLLKLESET